MPNILIEAMASGLPIACSDCGPMPEVLGANGVYFDPEKPDQIAKSLQILIENRSLREASAWEAYTKAQSYSWDKCARETFSFIVNVAKGSQNSTVAASDLLGLVDTKCILPSPEISISNDAIAFHAALALEWENKYLVRRSFKARERILTSIIRDSVRDGTIWLDAGCGTGRFSKILAKAGASKVIGIDGAKPMIATATDLLEKTTSERGEIEFLEVKSLLDLRFSDAAFDGILCSSVLEYIGSVDQTLTEFRRILKPAGLLIVTVPNRHALIRLFQNLSFGLSGLPNYLSIVRHQFSFFEAVKLFEKSGFESIRMEYGGLGICGRRLDNRSWWGPLMFFSCLKR